MQSLPKWVEDFNARSIAAGYKDSTWNRLLPMKEYAKSLPDYHPFEVAIFNDSALFPKKMRGGFNRMGNGAIKGTPFGNTILRQFAEEAIKAHELGKDEHLDFLSISFSSPDYIGHNYGPNSVEIHDNYLRLDQDIAQLFDLLDQEVGKGNYVVYLTSDHGVADLPDPALGKEAYLSSYQMDSALYTFSMLEWGVNLYEKRTNFQLYLNNDLMDSLQINRNEVLTVSIKYLSTLRGVEKVFDLQEEYDDHDFKKMKNGGFNGDTGVHLGI